MADVKISELPTKTIAGTDVVPVVDAGFTTTSRVTAADIAGLVTTATLGLATVATSGAYGDLSGTPSLATVAATGAYGDLSGTPALATVATTGSYNDLTDKPAASSGPSLGTVWALS